MIKLNTLIPFLVGLGIGLAVMWVYIESQVQKKVSKEVKKEVKNINTVMWNVELKDKRKNRLMDFLKDKKSITNNEAQKILGISDATATRYLDELEKEGKITQTGDTGRGVFYELK